MGEVMKRFKIRKIPLSDYERIIDTVTGEEYFVDIEEVGKLLDKMNSLSEHSDKVLEAFTTGELLKLKWQRDIYKNFAEETMSILRKHDIASLNKLDMILFNQVKW